jgi:hypothetical protein
MRFAICSSLASVSKSKCNRICLNPMGTSFDTPSVPRKSRSPSARIFASPNGIPRTVATAPNVTPAHPTSASSNMSAEHALWPSPPVAGCSPASTRAFPVSILHVMLSPTCPSVRRVTNAVLGCSRYCAFKGACNDLSSSAVIVKISRSRNCVTFSPLPSKERGEGEGSTC